MIFTPEMYALADKYEHETIEYARENPQVSKGMLVAVYAAEDPDMRVGTGIVEAMRWCNFFYQYICDVRMRDGNAIIVFAGLLKRQVYNAASVKAIARISSIKGGLS